MPCQLADVAHYELSDHCWAQRGDNANEYLTPREWWWAGGGDAEEGRKADCCLPFSMTFSFYILIILFTYIFITYVYSFLHYFLPFQLLYYEKYLLMFLPRLLNMWETLGAATGERCYSKKTTSTWCCHHTYQGTYLTPLNVMAITHGQAYNMTLLKRDWGIALKTEISHSFFVRVTLTNRIKTCTGKCVLWYSCVCMFKGRK